MARQQLPKTSSPRDAAGGQIIDQAEDVALHDVTGAPGMSSSCAIFFVESAAKGQEALVRFAAEES
jgi:hypothetical protein